MLSKFCLVILKPPSCPIGSYARICVSVANSPYKLISDKNQINLDYIVIRITFVISDRKDLIS